MINLYCSKKNVNCYVTFESRLKWQQLAEYSTDVIARLYQTIEKKGPVSGRRVSTQNYWITVTVEAMEFI